MHLFNRKLTNQAVILCIVRTVDDFSLKNIAGEIDRTKQLSRHFYCTTFIEPLNPQNINEALPSLQFCNTSASLRPDSYPVCKHVTVLFLSHFLANRV